MEKFDGNLHEQGTEHGPRSLIFSDKLNDLIESAKQYEHYDNRMKTIVKAAKCVREDTMDHNGFQFSGQFEPTCQKDSVPTSLKALVFHCLYGPNIKDQDKDDFQITLSVAANK